LGISRRLAFKIGVGQVVQRDTRLQTKQRLDPGKQTTFDLVAVLNPGLSTSLKYPYFSIR
jgi:hypothetical protein